MSDNKLEKCVCVLHTKGKSTSYIHLHSVFFRDAVSSAASLVTGAIDGSYFISRHTNTRTTHLQATTGELQELAK
jgi:hypothetical protein